MTPRRALVVCAALAAMACAAMTAAAADPLAAWRAGVNYRLLENPQPPDVAAGKVEVVEAFWYGCSHCFALDPLLEEWRKTKPAYIEFVRVPVIWSPLHRQHAKLYYTLQALHRSELHAEVFNAIHKRGLVLTDHDEARARSLQLVFLSGFGVNPQQFEAAYDSMTVAMNMQRAENFTRTLAVDSVPTVYVNGKYATSAGDAGGESQLITLINALAESEKR
ncbi:MAG TPA: thiol:disulfide interchange protein DsbA/DsbL [Steroidobacteraceae bacterium]|nr:thiol:disulfide interchange protein DsbA/DsbL [Steroidobacteraceae bacterium]